MKTIIISIIMLIIIILHSIVENKIYNNSYKDTLYKKVKKLKILLYILAFISLCLCLIVNISSNKETITIILNCLSIVILFLPLSLNNLYIKYFHDEEKYSHIKTIVTNIYDKNIYKKFNKSDINIIYLSSESPDNKFKTIEEQDIKSSLLKKNIHIKTTNENIVNKYLKENTIIKEFTDLNKKYTIIENSRGIHDNFIRSITYLIRTYLTLIISYLLLIAAGFPIEYNLICILSIKILTIFTSHYVYKKLPYDKDIMERKVKDKDILLGTQEIFLTTIEAFVTAFVCLVPYMYAISQGGTQALGNTLYLVTFICTQVLITFSKLNDSFIIINIIKSYKNIKLIIYTILSIIIVIFLNTSTILNTRNIELHNNLSCIMFSLIPIAFIEFTKLARYSTKKGKKKHELKNNKK